MPALEAHLDRFQAEGAVLLGINGDSLYSHQAWIQHHGLRYPLLSDLHRTVCKAYGVWNPERNAPRRATFILDRAGVVRFKEEYPPGQLPDPARLLDAVRAIPD